MAAPVVESVTTAITNGSSWTGTKPSGTVDDDYLIAHLTLDQVDTVTSVPSGWSLLHGPITPVGNDTRLYIYTKVAASEGADYTWGLSASNAEGALCLMRVSGVDTGAPVDVSDAATQDNNSATSHPSATIVTTVADTLALFFCAADESGAKARPYWQAIGGMTTEYDFEGDSTVYAGAYSETIASASSVQRTATTSSSDTSALVIMALRPSGTAPPTPSPPIGSLASTGVGR